MSKPIRCVAKMAMSEPVSIGCSIVFSTDVNAVELSPNPLFNKLKQLWCTCMQRMRLMSMLAEIIRDHSAIGSFSILKLRGCYLSPSGEVYPEHAVRLNLYGAETKVAESVAVNILHAFRQQSVMVCNHAKAIKYHIRKEQRS